jgi:hypothetical protein
VGPAWAFKTYHDSLGRDREPETTQDLDEVGFKAQEDYGRGNYETTEDEAESEDSARLRHQ